MTLLMFEQQDTWAIIVTDSLAVSETAGHTFQSKVRPLHHLNMVMVIRGSSNLMVAWHHHIVTSLGIRDIEDLNAVAPAMLTRLNADLTKAFGPLGTSEIYHFGFPRGSTDLVRYGYHSERGFRPERFQGPKCFISPPPKNMSADPDDWPQSRSDYIEMAMRSRAGNEVAIGGELFATEITDGSIHTMRWHRFPDYDEVSAAMRSHPHNMREQSNA